MCHLGWPKVPAYSSPVSAGPGEGLQEGKRRVPFPSFSTCHKGSCVLEEEPTHLGVAFSSPMRQKVQKKGSGGLAQGLESMIRGESGAYYGQARLRPGLPMCQNVLILGVFGGGLLPSPLLLPVSGLMGTTASAMSPSSRWVAVSASLDLCTIEGCKAGAFICFSLL